MNMKLPILLFSILVFAIKVNAQAPAKLYSSLDHTSGQFNVSSYYVSQDQSEDYFLLGTFRDSTNNANKGMFLNSVYKDGTPNTAFSIAEPTFQAWPFGLIRTNDNKNLVLGGIGQAPFLMNISDDGTINWVNKYNGSFNFWVGDIIKSADGSYIMAGEMNNSSQGANDIVLMKVNSFGNVVWNKYIGRSNQDSNPKIVELSNGNIVMTFKSTNASMMEEPILTVVSSIGTVIAHEVFDYVSGEMFDIESVTSSEDRIYVGGRHDPGGASNIIIMSYDYSLNPQYKKSYSTAGWPGISYLKVGGDKLYGFGYTENIIGNSDVLVLQIDTADGSIVTSKAFGNALYNDGSKPIINVDDNFVLPITNQLDNGSFWESEQGILIMNESMTLGCNEANVTFTEATFSPLTSTTTLLEQNTAGFFVEDITSDFTVNTETVTEVIACSVPLCNLSITEEFGMIEGPFCNGDQTGALYVNTNGASSPTVTYSWTGPNSFTASTEDISGLGAGTYSLYAIDGNGCDATFDYVMTEPDVLEISASSTADPLCNGDNNGSINITIAGGTLSYQPSWTGPNSFSSSLEDISGLAAGTYNLNLTDGGGCQVTTSYTLTDPTAMTINLFDTDVSCNGLCDGEIFANVSGGTPPYIYAWDDPASQVSATATGLCAGIFNYTINVADDNSCTISTNTNNENVTITEPTALDVSVSVTNSTCGDDNGTAEATVSGGTLPYGYSWTTGDNVNSIANIAPGSETLTLTDGNGCVETVNFDVNDTIYPVEICMVTVDHSTSSKNEIVWEKPVVGNLEGFNIYRDIVGTYTYLDFVDYDSLSKYVDTTNGVNPNTTSYRYKISTIDTCGNESELSEYHETMHLTINVGSSDEANLIWDAYEGFTFSYYRIMRDTILDGSWHAIDSVTPTNFTYTDSDVFANGANYVIEIVLPNTCTATKAQDHNSTRSNNSTIAGPGVPDYISESTLKNAKVYPNPTKGQFTVELEAASWEFSLYDLRGQLIKSKIVSGNKEIISTDDLESGVYMLQLKSNGSSTYKRIVKN